MTRDMKNLIIDYLNALDIEPSFDSCDIESNHHNLSTGALTRNIGQVKFGEGASKLCIIFQRFPFVIKWSTGTRYNEGLEEVENYQKAQSENLAFFFPKTELFYEHNGVSFVLQEKVDCSVPEARYNREYRETIARITKTPNNVIWQKMDAQFKKADSYRPRNLDPTWAKMAISLYGKKVCKNLCHFIVQNAINDLHANNIGYKNFKPIILDFSGYHR